MFSRNGQYLINEYEEDTFDKQLPSQSIKIPFKRTQQKVLNRIQQKYQLQLLKQQIHRKCKLEELSYLDQLQKEKLKFIKIKQQEDQNKKKYMVNYIQNKYKIQQQQNKVSGKNRSKTQQPIRDSIDEIKNNDNNNKTKQKYQFSLENTNQKKKQQIAEDKWVKRVQQGRKILQAKLGKYYTQRPKKDSDSDSSSSS